MRQSCNNDGHQQSDNNNHHHVGCKIIYFEFKTSEAKSLNLKGGPPVACYDSQKGKNSKNHVHLELEHLVQKYEVWTFGGGAICAGKLCRHSNCLRAAIFRINGRADHY